MLPIVYMLSIIYEQSLCSAFYEQSNSFGFKLLSTGTYEFVVSLIIVLFPVP